LVLENATSASLKVLEFHYQNIVRTLALTSDLDVRTWPSTSVRCVCPPPSSRQLSAVSAGRKIRAQRRKLRSTQALWPTPLYGTTKPRLHDTTGCQTKIMNIFPRPKETDDYFTNAKQK